MKIIGSSWLPLLVYHKLVYLNGGFMQQISLKQPAGGPHPIKPHQHWLIKWHLTAAVRVLASHTIYQYSNPNNTFCCSESFLLHSSDLHTWQPTKHEPWWEAFVCSTLRCDAMQWWVIVGSFLCAQLSAVHSNFLPESFMYEKLQSHHKPREGPFELNDIFAIINAVPAITLMAFGFFNHGFVPGLCFGGVSKYTAHNCCSKLTLQNLSNVFPGKFSFLANLFNILWCRLWLR